MYIMCLSKGLEAVKAPLKDGALPNRTLGFIPNAGDTYENPYFVEESLQRLKGLGITLVEIDLASDDRQILLSKLDQVDGLYVAGGNTFYLLHLLYKNKLMGLIRTKVKEGMPYFGESAGAVLLAKSIEPVKTIDDPDDAPELESFEGLGLLEFFPLPHVGKEKYKAVFDKFIAENKDSINIVQYTDEQAIITNDGVKYEIVTSGIVAI